MHICAGSTDSEGVQARRRALLVARPRPYSASDVGGAAQDDLPGWRLPQGRNAENVDGRVKRDANRDAGADMVGVPVPAPEWTGSWPGELTSIEDRRSDPGRGRPARNDSMWWKPIIGRNTGNAFSGTGTYRSCPRSTISSGTVLGRSPCAESAS